VRVEVGASVMLGGIIDIFPVSVDTLSAAVLLLIVVFFEFIIFKTIELSGGWCTSLVSLSAWRTPPPQKMGRAPTKNKYRIWKMSTTRRASIRHQCPRRPNMTQSSSLASGIKSTGA
jgi:hypothetical protein